MKMDILDKNIKFLRKNYPQLVTAVENNPMPYEQCLNKNEEPNLVIVKDNIPIYLHSRYNAEAEARKWVNSLDNEQLEAEHILIIGCGLGYYLEQLIDCSNAKNIYVYEPDISIFTAWVQSRDISKVLSDRRIRLFVLGEDDLLQSKLALQISEYAKKSFYMICPPIYNKHFESIVINMQQKIKEALYSQATNQVTLISHQDDWTTNILRNLKHAVMGTSAAKLQNIASGVTTIVVGSGPSLQYDVHYLKKIKSKCLIIAAGSSIQALERHGIFPHLVVSIDGGIPNYRVFQNIDTSQTPLLFCPQINLNILDDYKAPLIAATLSNDSLTQYFCSNMNLPIFRSSTSVTGTAIQFAAYLGSTQIILLGQDLSYPGKQFYTAGVNHASEEDMDNQIKEATLTVPNVDGGENPTSEYMKNMLDDMELQIQIVTLSGVRIINASRHGAVITGTEYIPMDVLITLLIDEDNHNIEIHKYLTLLSNDEKIDKLSSLNCEFEDMSQLTKVLGNRLNKLSVTIDNLANKIVNGNQSTLMKQLVEVNKLWGQITGSKAFEICYSFSMKYHINNYMRFVTDIVETEDVREKSKLITSHLGLLVKELSEFTPRLLSILNDATTDLNNYINQLSSN